MSKSIHFDADVRLVRDQSTPVNVVVEFDKPAKVRGIHATFRAAEKTEATYVVTTTDGKGKTQTETRTAVEYHDIVNQSYLLFGDERKGFFSRLLDSLFTWIGGGKHELVQPGKKDFDLEVKIPQQAPASLAGKVCEVFYRLEVKVDLPIKIDWSGSHQFEVESPASTGETAPVHVVFPDESGRSFWERTLGKKVTLNLAVDRDTLSPGEPALAMLTVETPEPLTVNEITVELFGEESVTAQGHSASGHHRHPMDAVDSPNVVSEESVHEFAIQIPEIEGPFTQSGANFEVRWWIEVRLNVPWAKDPVIRVPIRLVAGSESTS